MDNVIGFGPGNLGRGQRVRMDDLAVATAIASNTRYISDPDELWKEIVNDLGMARADRVWKMADAIFDSNYDDAA